MQAILRYQYTCDTTSAKSLTFYSTHRFVNCATPFTVLLQLNQSVSQLCESNSVLYYLYSSALTFSRNLVSTAEFFNSKPRE